MIGVDQQLERLLRKQLDDCDCQIFTAANSASAMTALGAKSFALVLVAEVLPEGRGIEFIRHTSKRFGNSRFVLVGNGEQLRTVVDAVQSGARDFLPLPLEPDGVSTLMERLEAGERREYDRVRQAADGFEEILTISPALKRAIAQARQVAPFDAPVLLVGETGTGKELFARAIHGASPRAGSSLVTVNCATMSEASIEIELLGHTRAASSGADQSPSPLVHLGMSREPAAGTLVLEDIDQLGANLQTKLLRFLRAAENGRMGADESLGAGVRLIATTDADLCEAVKRGKFRADLYYRLAVFPITIVPLRERREDIVLLARHFLQLLAARLDSLTPRLDAGAVDLLIGCDWPGNIRQLINVLERAMILHRNEDLAAAHLAPMLEAPKPGPSVASASNPILGWELPLEGINLDVLERDLMLQALARAEGDITRAAALVGPSRSSFRRRTSKLMGRSPTLKISEGSLKTSLYEMVQRRIN